jgi:hypothetical protein
MDPNDQAKQFGFTSFQQMLKSEKFQQFLHQNPVIKIFI